LGIYLTVKEEKYFFPFIDRYSKNVLNEIERIENQIQEVQHSAQKMKIHNQLATIEGQGKIKTFVNLFADCCNDLPNAFWKREKDEISLPFRKDTLIVPKRSKVVPMNFSELERCHTEIDSLKQKGLIQDSHSEWGCFSFYVNKHAEIIRGVPRLAVNYKPLNDMLEYDSYPIPKPTVILANLKDSYIFSKFDLKSEFWQIGIKDSEKYKTGFTVPGGHYEWNVMAFGLMNAPSVFQRIVEKRFKRMQKFLEVYIDDILIHSKTIADHEIHLQKFHERVYKTCCVLSQKKMELFKTTVNYLGYTISEGKITIMQHSLDFVANFPDEILEKQQLQIFLGSLNYLSESYKECAKDRKFLNLRLKDNPIPSNNQMTEAVKTIKGKLKTLPLLSIINENWKKVIFTDASNIGWGAALTQENPATGLHKLC